MNAPGYLLRLAVSQKESVLKISMDNMVNKSGEKFIKFCLERFEPATLHDEERALYHVLPSRHILES